MLEESEEDRNLLEKSSGQDRKPDKILLLKCFLAVLFCYLLYGICHEAIFKQVRKIRKIGAINFLGLWW